MNAHNDSPIAYKDRLARDLKVFGVASFFFFAIGVITMFGMEWYGSLAVPSWMPPEQIIAAIWGTLFVTTAVSLIVLFDAERTATVRLRTIVLLYLGNALLVLLWNYLFFGVHQLALAIGASVAVGISVLVLMYLVKGSSRTAAWLLAPYVAWVGFAIAASYSVMLLN